jgi:LysR family transcriptional regulator for bpeEF and oprC
MDRLDAMRVFCTVVEAGGFSKAADKLGMSTSSVTNQVAALEVHFKIKLLHRTTRRMSLTDEGRQCYEQAQRLLEGMQELEGSLQGADERPRGSLRVDVPALVARRFIAPALPRFLQAYPEITLHLSASDRHIDMVDDGVDVLVRIGELPDSALLATTLLRTRYVCCASPAFVARHGAPQTIDELDQFACLNFIYPKSRQLRPWQFEVDGAHVTRLPRAVMALDHAESLVEAAVAGCGIVQLTTLSVDEEVRRGTLVPLLQPFSAAGPDLSVLYAQRRHRAAKVKVFVDFVQALFGAH